MKSQLRHASIQRQKRSWTSIVTAFLLAAVAFAAPYLSLSAEKDKRKAPTGKALKGLAVTELGEDEAILHALNRLGFGPRPGEVERVRRMGLEKWISQQLAPDAIHDSAVQARLERFPTLTMSSSQLLDEFPRPQQAARQAGVTREEFQKQREERRKAREAAQMAGMDEMQDTDGARVGDEKGNAMARPIGRRGFGTGDPNNPPMRLEEVRAPQRIIAELAMAKMTRAIYSERQLYEAMADFWFNHFNVFAAKGADRWLITSYERDVIRPHAMGKFKDLLYATAESPAMLFYLDNWQSADPRAFERMRSDLAKQRKRLYGLYGMGDPLEMGMGRRGLGAGRLDRSIPQSGQGQAGQAPQARRQRGLNENYARELMELHTLGVDGGYTQQDVIEVAKCFTGWTLRAPRRNPEFYFDERIHDPDAKTVLGKKIAAGGIKDGEQVLDMLARHPNTAKFISTKLARRFVSDNPSPELVERMAKKFLDTDGDIRAVLRAMIDSPEFWSREAYRAKIKKPFELVVSAARALGTEVDVALPLVMWAARIGEPLYLCQPPTGYSDKAETWVNTGALLNRLNFSLALAGNRMRGARVDLPALLGQNAAGDSGAGLERALGVLLANQASRETRATLEKQLSDPQALEDKLGAPLKQVDLGVIAGLVLGAPEFQRR